MKIRFPYKDSGENSLKSKGRTTIHTPGTISTQNLRELFGLVSESHLKVFLDTWVGVCGGTIFPRPSLLCGSGTTGPPDHSVPGQTGYVHP